MTGVIPNADDLAAPFIKEVLNMLKKEGKIGRSIINNMKSWQHSGFNVHCGSPVGFDETDALERLARYIVRAPISQERMHYISETESTTGQTAKVIYEGKTTHTSETFSELDFMARLVTHIPNKREQTVRYYGYYSNKCRGVRAKAEVERIKSEASGYDLDIHTIGNSSPEASGSSLLIISASNLSRKKFKKNWARLIQKVYNVDPLKCPKCNGKMRIISFIEDEAVIKKILSHLNFWLPLYHDPPDDSPHDQAFKHNSYPLRSYEWWELVNNASSNVSSNTGIVYAGANTKEYYADDPYQSPYDDEFPEGISQDPEGISQEINYEEFSQESYYEDY